MPLNFIFVKIVSSETQRSITILISNLTIY